MGRKAHANYIEAALKVFEKLGPGPISTKVLVAVAQEDGLVGDGKWVYHNFSRKVRESDLFDTSVRGEIRLIASVEDEALAEEPVVEDSVEVQQSFPGPTLGGDVPKPQVAYFDPDEILRKAGVEPKD